MVHRNNICVDSTTKFVVRKLDNNIHLHWFQPSNVPNKLLCRYYVMNKNCHKRILSRT